MNPILNGQTILVTDGEQRAALAVTRSLGRKGLGVIVGAAAARSIAGASRYCVRTLQYPSPFADPEGFGDAIAAAVDKFDVGTIMPITDSTTRVLAEQRARFRPSVVASIPRLGAYDLVSDKYRLMRLAAELGVPIPETVFVPDGDVSAVIHNVKQYPVVVKPGRSIVRKESGWAKTNVHFVSNSDELLELYRQTAYLQYPSLVQQRIAGEGQGVFGYFDEGRPCALFAHRRVREKPPAGGVSVFRESLRLPKPMTEYAVRLLQHVKWHGVAMVEFKVERHSNVPMLMEVNGRFWGSLQLAIDAGIDFPSLLHRASSGIPVSVPDNSYRAGTKSRWLLGDVDHLLQRLLKSSAELHLDAHAPSRWRCLWDFCKFIQSDLHYEVESLTDPVPAFAEYRDWIAALLQRRH